jgi:hypothetical protein
MARNQGKHLVSRKKVLIVCMVDSIHVARWIGQFAREDIDFVLFPSGPNRTIHSEIRRLRSAPLGQNATFKIVPLSGLFSVPLWLLDRFLGESLRGWLLRIVVKRENPDVIHALEFQHAGYIVERGLRNNLSSASLIVTNYGSDIYWFQNFPKHLRKIQSLLGMADKYSAECSRDYDLAEKHGFRGTRLPQAPNSGLIREEDMTGISTPTSQRNLIAVKGYQGWVGRAENVIQALRLEAPNVRAAEIVFFSCNLRTLLGIFVLRLQTGLNVRGYRKNKLTHREILDLFSRSRLYVGVSLSDGLSTSAIEAMAMGAFPIQSSTSCASEWFIEGVSGRSLSEMSPSYIGKAISESFAESTKLDTAREMNLEIVTARFQSLQQSKSHLRFYD